MIPGPQGTVGQLAMFGKGTFGDVQAPGFGIALKLYVEGLESGSWLYRDGVCVSRRRGIRWASYVDSQLSR